MYLSRFFPSESSARCRNVFSTVFLQVYLSRRPSGSVLRVRILSLSSAIILFVHFPRLSSVSVIRVRLSRLLSASILRVRLPRLSFISVFRFRVPPLRPSFVGHLPEFVTYLELSPLYLPHVESPNSNQNGTKATI